MFSGKGSPSPMPHFLSSHHLPMHVSQPPSHQSSSILLVLLFHTVVTIPTSRSLLETVHSSFCSLSPPPTHICVDYQISCPIECSKYGPPLHRTTGTRVYCETKLHSVENNQQSLSENLTWKIGDVAKRTTRGRGGNLAIRGILERLQPRGQQK